MNSAPNGNEGAVHFALGMSERPANSEILPLRPLFPVLLLPSVIATWKYSSPKQRRSGSGASSFFDSRLLASNGSDKMFSCTQRAESSACCVPLSAATLGSTISAGIRRNIKESYTLCHPTTAIRRMAQGCPFGYGHTAQKAPLPVRSAKLSCARPR